MGIDTPHDLKKPPPDIPPWLAYTLGQIHNGVKTNTKKLDTMTVEIKKINGCLREEVQRSKNVDGQHDLRLGVLETKPDNPVDSSAITFKWLVDKLGAPIVTGIITAILVAAIILWATQGNRF